MCLLALILGSVTKGTQEVASHTDLLRKSTEGTRLRLALSVMFRTSTSSPRCHIRVFTAYLKMPGIASVPHELMQQAGRCYCVAAVHIQFGAAVLLMQAFTAQAVC